MVYGTESTTSCQYMESNTCLSRNGSGEHICITYIQTGLRISDLIYFCLSLPLPLPSPSFHSPISSLLLSSFSSFLFPSSPLLPFFLPSFPPSLHPFLPLSLYPFLTPSLCHCPLPPSSLSPSLIYTHEPPSCGPP